jgi:hypothetical protein
MKARSLDNLTEHWSFFCLGPVPSQANFPGSIEEVFDRTVSFKGEYEQAIDSLLRLFRLRCVALTWTSLPSWASAS